MIKENLKWDLRLEGERESELDTIRVRDVKFNGTILIKDANTGSRRTVFLPDRIHNKISHFIKNKKADDLVFGDNKNNCSARNNNDYRNPRNKRRVCLVE